MAVKLGLWRAWSTTREQVSLDRVYLILLEVIVILIFILLKLLHVFPALNKTCLCLVLKASINFEFVICVMPENLQIALLRLSLIFQTIFSEAVNNVKISMQ